jgi:hypothetical protein
MLHVCTCCMLVSARLKTVAASAAVSAVSGCGRLRSLRWHTCGAASYVVRLFTVAAVFTMAASIRWLRSSCDNCGHARYVNAWHGLCSAARSSCTCCGLSLRLPRRCGAFATAITAVFRLCYVKCGMRVIYIAIFRVNVLSPVSLRCCTCSLLHIAAFCAASRSCVNCVYPGLSVLL